MPSQPSKGVFLSYASEDSEAAAHIAAALAAAGIDVWFDRSELRGGDAWDQRIRQQIRDCALFVPIISAHTQARPEGYFRLEWRLAVDRSRLMAAEKAFLVPVVIDTTTELEALIPASFLDVQWTRIPSGEVPATFVGRIASLLRQPIAQHSGSQVPPTSPTSIRRRPVALAALAIAAVAGIVIAALMHSGLGHKPSAKVAKHTALASVMNPAADIPEKSVAVLPFVDMSEKKDQEYFSDGLSEELIDKLAHAGDLKVVARTSSFQFKGKNDDMRTIGKKLGVANLLEGSVRTSGNAIRVTAQLINVIDGTHRWSETYDRRKGDIFRVQDEIAAAVVKALKASLLEKSPASADTTNNAEAYALYLQGNYYSKSGTKEDFVKAVAALDQAVRLSPASARYWAELSRAYTGQYFVDATLAWNTMHNLALHAADKAMSLDPNLPEAHIARAKIAWYLDIDFPVVTAEIAKARLLAPNNPSVMLWSAAVAHLLGNDEDAIRITKRLAITDPLGPNIYADLSSYCFAAGRYEDAEAAARKALDLNGSTVGMHFIIGLAIVQLGGNRDTALAEIARESDPEVRTYGLAVANQLAGNTKESDSWLTVHEPLGRRSDAYNIAVLHALRGDLGQAFTWLDKAYAIRDSSISEIKTDPFLKSLRKDVRYGALLRKVGLPE